MDILKIVEINIYKYIWNDNVVVWWYERNRNINGWFRWTIRAFKTMTQSMMCSDPQYVWKRGFNELKCFLVWSSLCFASNGFFWMNHFLFARAHAFRANIRKTNERRFTHSPIKSYLLLNLTLFCDFMPVSSLCCSLLTCEEAAQAREQSLTKGKKWSAPWLLMHATEKQLRCGMLHAACGMARDAWTYVGAEKKSLK